MQPWFKFYREFISDPKIKQLSPVHQLMFVYLLCLSDEEGCVHYLSEQALKVMCGLMPTDDNWTEGDNAFDNFVRLSMITIDNVTICVTNFQKRQNSNLSNYERVKRFRDKKKQEFVPKKKTNVINDNAMITVDKIREDKNKKEIYKEKRQGTTKTGQEDANALALLEKYNTVYGRSLKSPAGFRDNLAYWMAQGYSLEDVFSAVENSHKDEFWRDKMTPDVLLRQKTPQGEAVDRVGQFMKSKKVLSTDPLVKFSQERSLHGN